MFRMLPLPLKLRPLLLLLLLLLYRKRLTWHLVLSELQGHITMSKS